MCVKFHIFSTQRKTILKFRIGFVINKGESSHINAFKNINMYESFIWEISPLSFQTKTTYQTVGDTKNSNLNWELFEIGELEGFNFFSSETIKL
jgi:hypothetical protein